MGLTGKFKFRKTLWGKIVLQLEEEVKLFWSRSKPLKRRWRDATLMDLAAPELRALIDLRYKPHFMTQHEYLAPDGASHQPIALEADTASDRIGFERPLIEARRGSRRPAAVEDVTVELERAQQGVGLRSGSGRTP
jgi:hypothetical protein